MIKPRILVWTEKCVEIYTCQHIAGQLDKAKGDWSRLSTSRTKKQESQEVYLSLMHITVYNMEPSIVILHWSVPSTESDGPLIITNQRELVVVCVTGHSCFQGHLVWDFRLENVCSTLACFETHSSWGHEAKANVKLHWLLLKVSIRKVFLSNIEWNEYFDMFIKPWIDMCWYAIA